MHTEEAAVIFQRNIWVGYPFVHLCIFNISFSIVGIRTVDKAFTFYVYKIDVFLLLSS